MRKIAAAMVLTAMAAPTMALDKLPEESGFSGFVNLGVGAGNVESNFLARIAGADIDLGDDTIKDLGSPDGEDIVMPAIGVNVGYTFANKKTRIALGNDLADFLQFDRATLLSLRHDFDNIGNFQLGLLNSAGLATEVWADPYLVGEKRKDTEFSSSGGRITWDKILGSEFEVKLTARKRDIDDERSGEDLVRQGVITSAEAKLLDREGDVMRAEVGYMIYVREGAHLIRPSIAYIDRDLDGDAMSQDGYEIAVSWAYSNGDNFRWVNNVAYASMDGDKTNPIFDEVNDMDRLALSSAMFFPGLFGLEKWTPNVSVAWGEDDSDIDFNDTNVWVVSASMFRRF